MVDNIEISLTSLIADWTKGDLNKVLVWLDEQIDKSAKLNEDLKQT